LSDNLLERVTDARVGCQHPRPSETVWYQCWYHGTRDTNTDTKLNVAMRNSVKQLRFACRFLPPTPM